MSTGLFGIGFSDKAPATKRQAGFCREGQSVNRFRDVHALRRIPPAGDVRRREMFRVLGPIAGAHKSRVISAILNSSTVLPNLPILYDFVGPGGFAPMTEIERLTITLPAEMASMVKSAVKLGD
ncbi:MAG: hypothetical protein JO172_05705 [Hyphomicrobiales bacterium]|nr:hypothetical protein [Hyphomicrobiales bacterium]